MSIPCDVDILSGSSKASAIRKANAVASRRSRARQRHIIPLPGNMRDMSMALYILGTCWWYKLVSWVSRNVEANTSFIPLTKFSLNAKASSVQENQNSSPHRCLSRWRRYRALPEASKMSLTFSFASCRQDYARLVSVRPRRAILSGSPLHFRERFLFKESCLFLMGRMKET